MSREVDQAWLACESALRAIDASLSTLVLARENIVTQMQAMAGMTQDGQPGQQPTATMGHVPDPDCPHPEDRRMNLGVAELCEACGEQVPGE